MTQDNSTNRPDQQALNPNPRGLDPNDPNVARDPVCGTLLDKRTAQNTLSPSSGTNMQTLYFDSPDCKALFEEDPARYGYPNY
jgi:YHS domain-containing protein